MSKSDQLTLFAGDTHASHLVLPASERAREMTAISGRNICDLYENCAPVGSLGKMLLGTSVWASTMCYLTWKEKVTPGKRLLFQLAPSMPDTGETESGLLPTATATDNKSESMSLDLVKTRLRQSSRGIRITELINRMAYGLTPNAGSDHWGGRLDEMGGSSNPFRGSELGKMKLNPCWQEERMGFPIGWTDLEHSETQLSPKSRKSSVER